MTTKTIPTKVSPDIDALILTYGGERCTKEGEVLVDKADGISRYADGEALRDALIELFPLPVPEDADPEPEAPAVKPGDRLLVTATHGNHGFPVGTVVQVVRQSNIYSGTYLCTATGDWRGAPVWRYGETAWLIVDPEGTDHNEPNVIPVPTFTKGQRVRATGRPAWYFKRWSQPGEPIELRDYSGDEWADREGVIFDAELDDYGNIRVEFDGDYTDRMVAPQRLEVVVEEAKPAGTVKVAVQVEVDDYREAVEQAARDAADLFLATLGKAISEVAP